MTREEAIKELKEDIELYIPLRGTIDDVDRDLPDGRLITALEMAIKALEQEPCEDAISREDALMALTGEWTELTDEVIHRFIKRIKALSSVIPQYTENEIQKIQDLEQAEIEKAYELGKAEGQECEDAISRQAAIDALTKTSGIRGDALKALYDLPSVNPQELKIGHWIEDDMTYCGVDLTNYKCDKCGEIGGAWRKGLKPDKLPKYCMNCGCAMVEPQESEGV